MQNRRKFIKVAGAGSAFLASGVSTLSSCMSNDPVKITILHTNDTHSRFEPFPDDHPKYPGMGGMAKRAKIVEDIRNTDENVLLVDAGDIFQGTPYFNYYGGELNFKLMSMLKYDVATIGNHDLDNGIDGFAKHLKHANFPFVNCNYDFTNTVLEGKLEAYKTFMFSGIKVGVFGIGIELEGLVDPKNYNAIKYLDPIESANNYARILKEEEKCDLVIMLSHLGYKYRGDKVSDVVVAENTNNIDLIVGGHTHTFMKEPDVIKNKAGEDTIVSQAGFAGINIGRIDFYFDKNKKPGVALNKYLEVKSDSEEV
ncbi:MAG: metallophosphatase [Bacteroidota bacterium]